MFASFFSAPTFSRSIGTRFFSNFFTFPHQQQILQVRHIRRAAHPQLGRQWDSLIKACPYLRSGKAMLEGKAAVPYKGSSYSAVAHPKLGREWNAAIKACPFLQRGKAMLEGKAGRGNYNSGYGFVHPKIGKQWDSMINACPYLRRGKAMLKGRTVWRGNNNKGGYFNYPRVFVKRPNVRVFRPYVRLIQPRIVVSKPNNPWNKKSFWRSSSRFAQFPPIGTTRMIRSGGKGKYKRGGKRGRSRRSTPPRLA